MRVAVVSAFRNAPPYQTARWLDQVATLSRHRPDWAVVAIAVEGDSTDDTQRRLVTGAAKRSLKLQMVNADHGGPRFGSVEDPQRMSQLSFVLNCAMASVPSDVDIVLYVESDLIWDSTTVVKLVSLVNEQHPIVVPMIFAGGNFYDTWAFRKNGERFAPFAPYHSRLLPAGLTEVDSAGSCLVMLGEVARETRVRDGNALVGWCAQARKQGRSVYVAAELGVSHPA